MVERDRNKIADQSHGTSFAETRRAENIVALFEASVTQYPHQIALRFQDAELSYRDLYDKVSALAEYLRTRGVTRGVRVAISLDRGFDLVIAAFAILETGGVFLPIDPLYPQDRREFMIADAEPAFIISTSSLIERNPITTSRNKLLLLDEISSSRTIQKVLSSKSHGAQIDLSDPAYVIYTSGSTGRPKGALNSHRGLFNLAQEQIAVFGITSASRILQFASSSFDASISEFVMALGAGATLVLAKQSDMIPGPSLVRLLLEQRISHVTLPPSVLAVLPDRPFPDLEVIIVAGEACPIELARRWSQRCRFFNAYGVSEAAVCSSIKEFDPGLDTLPIGKAMGGVELVVLDADKEPVAAGDVGELYIGGVGVGLGYLNRPDLNEEKFVSLSEGHRFYRTGDRVRLLSDGALEYVGRQDNQVKLRGFRIELDEVAVTIEQFESVLQCVVVVTNDTTSGGQLTAYLKVEPHLNLSLKNAAGREDLRAIIANLRSFLAGKLPAHMIPAHFIPIDIFPLSPTGKVDLAALRAKIPDRSFVTSHLRSPNTAREQQLSDLCCELLHLDALPMEGSFLDLGGDSLQAARLVWMIEEHFSVQMTEADILGATNFVELARQIEGKVRRPLPALEPVERRGPVDPAPIQEIFEVLEKLGVDTSPLNCCAAFDITGDLDKTLLQRAYGDLFARHEALRLTFPLVGDTLKVTAHEKVDAKIEFLDFSTTEDQANLLSTFFARVERTRFSIQSDLLVRCYLIHLEQNRSLFVLVSHHAMFDAWSVNVFLQDLFALVSEKVTGRSLVLPLKIQFLDYVDWLHKTLQLQDTVAQHAYLSNVFAKPLHFFDLREIKARPSFKSRRGCNAFCGLNKTETAQLSTCCDSRQLTPFMMCAAILKVALYCSSGQPDITVGGPVSIRYHRELERQIGLYGSAYILRTVLNEDETMESFLQRMRQNLLDAYRSQVHSIGRVLQQFEFELDLSRSAPYDVAVTSIMFDMPLCDPEVAKDLGIVIKPYRFPLTTSFFDLEFTFHLFDGEIELETRFDTALYRLDQIEKIHNDFRRILLSTLENPKSVVGALVAGATQ